MKAPVFTSLSMHVDIETWPLTAPFQITGHVFESIDVLHVVLERDGHMGQGEAAGVYYLNDTVGMMADQLSRVRASIETQVSRDTLAQMLRPGGARNAVDCALWDLEAKLLKQPAWQLAEIDPPRPIITTFGCGADTPEAMASLARSYTQAKAIKLKLTGERIDAQRVRAVREARPDVWLGVDANQGFSRFFLEELMPVLVQARVSLIEQPFPVGQEGLLEGLHSPIPVAADESAQTLKDLPALAGRFSMVNIKLDKCGGLTEGLAMARACRSLGLGTMVGNMIGTSLAMAPAFLVGQLCGVVDLDGPLFLRADRGITASYADGYLVCPEALWGGIG